MKPETIEKLAIAELFTHHAKYAGVARQAVADGYSAIDAMFSATRKCGYDKDIVCQRSILHTSP